MISKTISQSKYHTSNHNYFLPCESSASSIFVVFCVVVERGIEFRVENPMGSTQTGLDNK